jgi:endonuclease V-like protein UPF0215 family
VKVTINGRDMNERVEELAKREQQYFEVIKTAGFIIVGSVVLRLYCLSYFTTLPAVLLISGRIASSMLLNHWARRKNA